MAKENQLFLKWLNLRKFIFFFPLRTGVQIYGFTSFVLSILIADILLTKLIDQQMCAAFRSKSVLFECLSTKHIIIPQACQAFMSALMLCCVKRASVPLCWVGCKFVVTIIEYSFLLEWTKNFFAQFFNLNLQLAWFAVPFTCIYVYGVLVALSYYAELAENQASYSLSSTETNVDIPVPPVLPNF